LESAQARSAPGDGVQDTDWEVAGQMPAIGERIA